MGALAADAGGFCPVPGGGRTVPVISTLCPMCVRELRLVGVEAVLAGGRLLRWLTAIPMEPNALLTSASLRLFEELCERIVIEQFLRPDAPVIDSARIGHMGREGAMTAPGRAPDALDLTMEPELVHDVAHAFNAHIGAKCADFLRAVPAVRFHMLEDDACEFAQGRHNESIGMTPTWPFRSVD